MIGISSSEFNILESESFIILRIARISASIARLKGRRFSIPLFSSINSSGEDLSSRGNTSSLTSSSL